jgi:Zn-dependent protease/predicted transcriptional regulator
MSWSIRVGRIFGIDFYVHLTFLLLLVWIGVGQYLATGSWPAALGELVFVLLVFGTVVLHECGHALAARQFGIATRDITLLPIGGVARLERIPEKPIQELVIALAGPAVNVLLAVGCLGWLAASYQGFSAMSATLFQGGLMQRLLWVNVALVVFNMLPAFPMDGGRVLRALLAMGMNYVRATQIAAFVGQGFALLIGILGLFGNPLLLLIALFVWIGAAQEAAQAQTRSGLAGAVVRNAMMSEFRSASPEEPLEAVAHRVLDGFQHDFPVVQQGHVIGMLTRETLLQALAQRGGAVLRVADVMNRDFVSVEPQQPLTETIGRLQASECDSIPVIENGHLVGVISAENVSEYMLIQAAGRQSSLAA